MAKVHNSGDAGLGDIKIKIAACGELVTKSRTHLCGKEGFTGGIAAVSVRSRSISPQRPATPRQVEWHGCVVGEARHELDATALRNAQVVDCFARRARGRLGTPFATSAAFILVRILLLWKAMGALRDRTLL